MLTRLLAAVLTAVLAAGLTAVLTAVLTAAAPAAAAASPAEAPTRTVTYEVRARGAVQADLGQFARIAARTFNDRRGWSLGGSIRFVEVASGGEFTLWLAAPSTLPGFSSVCSPTYSCRVGRHVVINDERWRTGTATWPTVREYRSYVLNHELGHWLGLGHAGCPRAGAPALVMQQQSKGLDGCRTSTWPLEQERRSAAAHARVEVRSSAPALYGVDRAGEAGSEVHVLGGGTDYATRLLHARPPLGATADDDWSFAVADHDADGVDDLYAIAQRGGSGRTEVHVLDGASGYRSWSVHAATALHATSDDWTFAVADVDGDGHLDLYGIDRKGATGTEVHVLDGGSAFSRFLVHAPTALHRSDRATWSFALGDHDRDGVPDVHAVAGRGASQRTEVHVLSGAGGFRTWLAHTVTPLGPTHPDSWSFAAADHDADGYDDLLAVARAGASGRTEAHVLDDGGTGWLLHAATALPASRGEAQWSFAAR